MRESMCAARSKVCAVRSSFYCDSGSDYSYRDEGKESGCLAVLDGPPLDPKPYYWIGRPVSTLDNPNPTIFVHNRF